MEETLDSILASIPKLLEGKGADMEEGWPVWAQCVVCYKEKVKDANVGDAKKIYGGCDFYFLPCVHVVCSKACLEKCRHEREDEEEEEQSSEEKVVGGRTKAPVDGHPSRCPICDTSFSETLITSRIRPLSLLGMETLPKQERGTIFVPRRCQACIRLNLASRFCNDCQTAMCTPCVKYHAIIPETMSHVMTDNVDHLMESVSITEICNQHPGSRLIKQCITCEKQICEYCRGHSQHNVALLSEYAKSCKSHLDNIFKEFSTSLKRCQDIGEHFKKNYDKHENKVARLQDEAQTTLENIMIAIKNRERDMREDIVVKLTFKAFRLNVHASVLESLISQSERFFQYYECFNGPQVGVNNAGWIYRLIQKQMLYLRDRTNEIVNEPLGDVGIDVSRLDDTLKAIDNLCKFETVWTKKCPDAVCSGIDSSSVLSPPVSIHNDNVMIEIPINNEPQTVQTKSKETQETANSLVSNQAGKNSAASKEATRPLPSSSYVEENPEENFMEFQAFFIDNSSEEDEEDDTTGRIKKKKKKIKIKTEPIERDDDRDEASEDDDGEVQIQEEISAEIEQNDDEATPAVIIKREPVPRPDSANSNVSNFYCNENSDSSSDSDSAMGEENQEREHEPPFENHIIKVEAGTEPDEINEMISFSQKNHQENSETEEPESILPNVPSPSDDRETRREESSDDGFEERCGISSERSSDEEEEAETILDALTGKMIPNPNYGSIKIKAKKAKSPLKNTNESLDTSEGQEKKLFLNPISSPPKINSDLNYIRDENGRPVIPPPSLVKLEASDQREELEESTAVNTREVESAPITAAPLPPNNNNNNNSASPSSSAAVFDGLLFKYSSASAMVLKQKRPTLDKSPAISNGNSSAALVGWPLLLRRQQQQQPQPRQFDFVPPEFLLRSQNAAVARLRKAQQRLALLNIPNIPNEDNGKKLEQNAANGGAVPPQLTVEPLSNLLDSDDDDEPDHPQEDPLADISAQGLENDEESTSDIIKSITKVPRSSSPNHTDKSPSRLNIKKMPPPKMPQSKESAADSGTTKQFNRILDSGTLNTIEEAKIWVKKHGHWRWRNIQETDTIPGRVRIYYRCNSSKCPAAIQIFQKNEEATPQIIISAEDHSKECKNPAASTSTTMQKSPRKQRQPDPKVPNLIPLQLDPKIPNLIPLHAGVTNSEKSNGITIEAIAKNQMSLKEKNADEKTAGESKKKTKRKRRRAKGRDSDNESLFSEYIPSGISKRKEERQNGIDGHNQENSIQNGESERPRRAAFVKRFVDGYVDSAKIDEVIADEEGANSAIATADERGRSSSRKQPNPVKSLSIAAIVSTGNRSSPNETTLSEQTFTEQQATPANKLLNHRAKSVTPTPNVTSIKSPGPRRPRKSIPSSVPKTKIVKPRSPIKETPKRVTKQYPPHKRARLSPNAGTGRVPNSSVDEDNNEDMRQTRLNSKSLEKEQIEQPSPSKLPSTPKGRPKSAGSTVSSASKSSRRSGIATHATVKDERVEQDIEEPPEADESALYSDDEVPMPGLEPEVPETAIPEKKKRGRPKRKDQQNSKKTKKAIKSKPTKKKGPPQNKEKLPTLSPQIPIAGTSESSGGGRKTPTLNVAKKGRGRPRIIKPIPASFVPPRSETSSAQNGSSASTETLSPSRQNNLASKAKKQSKDSTSANDLPLVEASEAEIARQLIVSTKTVERTTYTRPRPRLNPAPSPYKFESIANLSSASVPSYNKHGFKRKLLDLHEEEERRSSNNSSPTETNSSSGSNSSASDKTTTRKTNNETEEPVAGPSNYNPGADSEPNSRNSSRPPSVEARLPLKKRKRRNSSYETTETDQNDAPSAPALVDQERNDSNSPQPSTSEEARAALVNATSTSTELEKEANTELTESEPKSREQGNID